MKLYLYITDPEDYFITEYHRFFAHTCKENIPDHWMYAGEVDFEPEFDEVDLRKAAADELSQKIKQVNAEAQVRIDGLENRRQKLFAIDHKPVVTE